jgi:hypothetical protein
VCARGVGWGRSCGVRLFSVSPWTAMMFKDAVVVVILT